MSFRRLRQPMMPRFQLMMPRHFGAAAACCHTPRCFRLRCCCSAADLRHDMLRADLTTILFRAYATLRQLMMIAAFRCCICYAAVIRCRASDTRYDAAMLRDR